MDAHHAVALVVQRGFDLELIPVWDMVNHDVRQRVNIETNSVRSSEGLIVWAKKPITAGEEIFYSYNYCVDCENLGAEWGTPALYRDFGFLEGFPQEWPFLDQEIFSRIQQERGSKKDLNVFSALLFPRVVDSDYEKDDDDDADELEQLFVPKLNDESLNFFHTHLIRLKNLDLPLELEQVSLPHERHMIQEYFNSLLIAISSVVEAGNDGHLQKQEMSVRLEL